MDELRFSKYHGTGNDFVMVEDLDDTRPLDPALVAAVCDRRFGVGADGVIRVTRGDAASAREAVPGAEGAEFFMDYRNADGSLAEMCGNGIRCLGKLAYERGHTRSTELDVATRGGLRHLSLHVEDGTVAGVSVDMGPAALERGRIPMEGPAGERFLEQPFEAAGRAFTASAVSMGNPHLVLLLNGDPRDVNVHAIGPTIENDRRFPEKTNVEFVAPDGEGGLVVRVWERGSGETMACGTGACAALVAANEAGIVPASATLRFPGGPLEVERRPDGRVILTGPAVHVFDGIASRAWLEAAMRTVAAASRA